MRYLTFLLPLVFFISSCGGGSDTQQTQDQQAADQQADQNTEAQVDESSSEEGVIKIIGVDQMKFAVENPDQEGITTGDEVGSSGLVQLETIKAEPGEEITIKLKTKSDLPAAAMSHNFILLKRDADAEAFDKAASSAKDNDYIPSDMTDQIIEYTDLAAGGETVEVTFTAPDEPGENTFLCSFPGHFASGMKGTLVVE